MNTKNVETNSKPRLIVLVPEALAGSPALAKKIFWMAFRGGQDVLFLVSYSDSAEKLTVSRRMATMNQLASSEYVGVSCEYILTSSWLPTLKSLYASGDRVVCHAEQFFRTGLFKTSLVAAWISDQLHMPVDIISGCYHPMRDLANKWLVGALLWLGFLAILAGFGVLEIQIDLSSIGISHAVMLVILVTLETGAIWAWNRILQK